jgi:hypothetical protein
VALLAGCLLVGSAAGILAVRHPLPTVLAVAALAVAMLAFSRLDLLILAAIPLSVAQTMFGLGYGPEDVAEPPVAIAVSLVTGLALLPAIRRPARSFRLRVDWPPLCALALIGVVAASTTVHEVGQPFGPPPEAYDRQITGLILLSAGLLLVVLAALAPPDPAAFARVVVLAGAVVAGYALINNARLGGRLWGLGLQYDYLGAALTPAVCVGVAIARQTRRPAWLVPAALCLVAVHQTQSRGALLGVLAGTALAVLAGKPRSHKLAGCWVLAVAGLLLTAFPDQILGKIFDARPTGELTTTTGRSDITRANIGAALHHPLRGIGLEMFRYYTVNDPRLGVDFNTHNEFLRFAAEAGVPAMLLFVALIVPALATRKAELVPLQAGVVATCVVMLFTNMLTTLAVSVVFWISLGCLLGHRRIGWMPRSPAGRHRRRSVRDSAVEISTEELSAPVRCARG